MGVILEVDQLGAGAGLLDQRLLGFAHLADAIDEMQADGVLGEVGSGLQRGLQGGRVELAIRAAEEGWLDIEPPAEPVGSGARSS